ncbi:hypothetical protein T635_2704 [Acinetobacter baumannii MRSN 7341]|nr:hypothetical protein T635_2704 [Acinetobacter baumannii MRSN 7341]
MASTGRVQSPWYRYKPFQVAIERAGNQISSKGYDVMVKDEDAKLYHELLMDACAPT